MPLVPTVATTGCFLSDPAAQDVPDHRGVRRRCCSRTTAVTPRASAGPMGRGRTATTRCGTIRRRARHRVSAAVNTGRRRRAATSPPPRPQARLCLRSRVIGATRSGAPRARTGMDGHRRSRIARHRSRRVSADSDARHASAVVRRAVASTDVHHPTPRLSFSCRDDLVRRRWRKVTRVDDGTPTRRRSCSVLVLGSRSPRRCHHDASVVKQSSGAGATV